MSVRIVDQAALDRVTVAVGPKDLKLHVVTTGGTKPALVYFHPAGGLLWDDFLAELSLSYTVYAPLLPGTAPDDSFAIHAIDDIFDLILVYEEALRSLGVQGAPVIGQSFGGMLAAELASCFPDLFTKIVLLDPAGLWNSDLPWNLDFLTADPSELPGLLFKNPERSDLSALLAPAEDRDRSLEDTVRTIWALGCAAKFLWPIPERGLAKRLHRLASPTLIVWGEDDRLIPSAYASEFASRIRNSRVELIADCGHIPQVEQMERTLTVVREFLGEGP